MVIFFSILASESAVCIGHAVCIRHCWEVLGGDDKQYQYALFPYGDDLAWEGSDFTNINHTRADLGERFWDV